MKNKKIIECFRLEGTLKSPSPNPSTIQQTRVLRAPFNLTQSISRDIPSSTSLGNLTQCLTTFIIKKFLPFFSFKHSLSLKLFSLVLSIHALEKSSPAFLQPLRYWKAASPWSQLSLPVFTTGVLWPSDHLCGSPLDSFQQVPVFFILGSPWDGCSAPGEGSSEGSRAAESPPLSSWPSSFGCSQDPAGLQAHILCHIEFLVNQCSQVLSSGLLSIHSPSA